MGMNVKCSKFLAAATFEKAKTYVFAARLIHNPKVGGSIPPLATSNLNELKSYEKKEIGPLAMRGKMGLGNIQLSPDLTEITCHSSSVTDNKIII
jgi:hypothetical protein